MNRLLHLCLLAVLLLPAACAGPGTYAVLLPDDDGRATAITITTQGGQRVLDQAGNGVAFDDAKAAPGQPFAVDRAQLAKDFGAAMAAQPPKPVRFILYFKTDQTELTEESSRDLPRILETVRGWSIPWVSVVGHADRTGDTGHNDVLALQRAEAVRGLLMGQGLGATRIEVESHGENNPLIPTAKGVAEPRNRRVEVTVR